MFSLPQNLQHQILVLENKELKLIKLFPIIHISSPTVLLLLLLYDFYKKNIILIRIISALNNRNTTSKMHTVAVAYLVVYKIIHDDV